LAWCCTAVGGRTVTNMLLRTYRRAGLPGVERLFHARMAPDRVGGQLFNLARALQREGDHSGAEAVYRRAAQLGFAPAMWNLGSILRGRGEEAEALALHRRALRSRPRPDGA
jgi:tetratricopeptide (TPR) repeat protein